MRATLFAMLLSIAAVSCGSDTASLSMDLGTTIAVIPSQPTQTAPSDHLMATVSAVRVHIATDATEAPTGDGDVDRDVDEHACDGGVGEDCGSGGGEAWVSILPSPVSVDLLADGALDTLVDGASVPAGRVTQLRLVLAAAPTYVHEGTSSPVSCPSCTESGIKVVTRGTVVLAAGDHLALHLALSGDFDATRLRLDPVEVIAR